ncbi:MAG TPA: hypothetical protein VFA26_23245 [Gemmataceae bacterium]|nr:hypothetical protein [Gemmataceae bacterium]
MLAEWIEHLVTPCPRPVRAMGYLRELIGIKARHARCRAAWAPHLERTRAVILRAAALCPRKRKAVMLGSGLLYDVPLDELAGQFREVVLVDLVHPLGSLWRGRRHENVRLLTADVTATIAEVYRVARTPGASLPRAAPSLFCDDPEVDLVASVNLASQLPYVPTTYLVRKGVHPADAIDAYGRDLISAHFDYLRRLPGVVALVADLEKLTLNEAGRVTQRASALRHVPLPWKGEDWVWRLAPAPEADPHYSYYRRVVGIPDIKRAARA